MAFKPSDPVIDNGKIERKKLDFERIQLCPRIINTQKYPGTLWVWIHDEGEG